MKKYPLVFLVVILLMFSGCVPNNSKEERADVSSFFENINASFSASFGELETKGYFTFTPETLSLEFTFPKTISGLRINVNNQSVSLSFNGLSVTKENSSVTEKFNAFAVYSVLNRARLDGLLNKTDSKTAITGDGFEIMLDGENRVSKILIPEKRINIELEW